MTIESGNVRKAREYAENHEIRIPKYDKQHLYRWAIKSYNMHYLKRGGYHASWKSDPGFLKRIAINHLRHECTSYDWELKRLYGKGLKVAHDILRKRINEKIIEVYPWLKDGLKHTDYK